MTRAVIGSQTTSAPPLLGDIELNVTTYAPGRYVGFALPDASLADPAPREAIRQSLFNLGLAAHALPSPDPLALLAAGIDDPQVRDATLGALKKLLPYRDKTIDAVEIRGRALGATAAGPATLDRQAWQTAHRLMAHPVEEAEKGVEKGTFTGHMLQIDYELRRFELRWLDDSEFSRLRCAYPAGLAAACEGLAKRKVEVRGAVAFRQGRPRLLQVEAIRAID